MSDVESLDGVANAEEESEEVTDLTSAIRRVLKTALIHDGVVRGIHEVTKLLDSKRAQICFVSEGCSEPAYIKLIQALCNEHSVPLIAVGDSKELGQWTGLCKIDQEGVPRNVVGASCVAIRDYGEESEALNFLQEHIKNMDK